jgi:hypothetical protein
LTAAYADDHPYYNYNNNNNYSVPQGTPAGEGDFRLEIGGE